MTHPSLGDGGEDGSADHVGVSVELQVVKQQAGGQQHGRGVGCVAVSDAFPGIPGALHTQRSMLGEEMEEGCGEENTSLLIISLQMF